LVIPDDLTRFDGRVEYMLDAELVEYAKLDPDRERAAAYEVLRRAEIKVATRAARRLVR
jgi:hypothetical protein